MQISPHAPPEWRPLPRPPPRGPPVDLLPGRSLAAPRESDVLQAATMGTVGVVDQFLLQESTQRVVQLRAAVRLHEGSLLVANKRTTKRAGMCSTRTSVVVLRERTNHNLVEDDMRAGGHLGRMETILGPKNNRTLLHVAAIKGNGDLIDLLLDKYYSTHGKALLSLQDGQQRSALHWVALTGRDDLVRQLLDKGISPDLQDADGDSPLHVAARQGHDYVVRTLLDKEGNRACDPRMLNKEGHTPLYEAIMSDNIDCIKSLIYADSTQVHIPDREGTTPLFLAVAKGTSSVIQSIMKLNVDFSHTDHQGNNALHVAVIADQPVILRFLKDRIPIDSKNHKGLTPLHLAAIEGNLPMVRELVVLGASKSLPDEEGRTPLHWAVAHGRLDLVAYLMGQLADKNAQDNEGSAPLHDAVDSNQLEVVKRLICKVSSCENDLDIDLQDNLGCTALHYAAVNGYVDELTLLIEAGARIDIRDKDGSEPIHWAVLNGQRATLNKLVEHGANINAEGKSNIPKCVRIPGTFVAHSEVSSLQAGNSPANMVVLAGNQELLEYMTKTFRMRLEAKNWLEHTPLYSAALRGDSVMIKILADCGANVNPTDEDGMTPLHDAAQKGNVLMVQELLSLPKIDPNMPEQELGFSPLHVAVASGRVEVVAELLGDARVHKHRKASIDILGLAVQSDNLLEMLKLLLSYVEICAQATFHQAPLDNLPVLRLYLEYKVDPHATDQEGNTVLHKAASKYPEALELFIQEGVDPRIKNDVRVAPMDIAKECEHQGCILILRNALANVLIKEAGLEYTFVPDGSQTPLHSAVISGRADVVRELAKAGMHLNETDEIGYTALHAAIASGHAEIVQELAQAPGINLNEKDKDGLPPLVFAIMKAWSHEGMVQSVVVLAENGALATEQDEDGNTALHIAATAGNTKGCLVLLRAGADVNAQNKKGNTPLHLAARTTSVGVCQILIDNGALDFLMNKDHVTAKEFAEDSLEAEIRELFGVNKV